MLNNYRIHILAGLLGLLSHFAWSGQVVEFHKVPAKVSVSVPDAEKRILLQEAGKHLSKKGKVSFNPLGVSMSREKHPELSQTSRTVIGHLPGTLMINDVKFMFSGQKAPHPCALPTDEAEEAAWRHEEGHFVLGHLFRNALAPYDSISAKALALGSAAAGLYGAKLLQKSKKFVPLRVACLGLGVTCIAEQRMRNVLENCYQERESDAYMLSFKDRSIDRGAMQLFFYNGVHKGLQDYQRTKKLRQNYQVPGVLASGYIKGLDWWGAQDSALKRFENVRDVSQGRISAEERRKIVAGIADKLNSHKDELCKEYELSSDKEFNSIMAHVRKNYDCFDQNGKVSSL